MYVCIKNSSFQLLMLELGWGRVCMGKRVSADGVFESRFKDSG